ncbi:MAG: hypothetical protein RLY86_14 [Pseudomonadota bacterium]|jgi:copper(I)-binding protein
MKTMLIRLLAAGALLTAVPAAASDVTVADAFARATAPAAKAGAAYMTITSPKADRLVAAASPVAERVELHTHVMDGGIARMREVEGGVVLPAGETVVFAPGGLHLMFMGLKQPLTEGAMVPVTLTLESGATLVVEVPVKSAAHKPAGAQEHGGGHSH